MLKKNGSGIILFARRIRPVPGATPTSLSERCSKKRRRSASPSRAFTYQTPPDLKTGHEPRTPPLCRGYGATPRKIEEDDSVASFIRAGGRSWGQRWSPAERG